jgi:hypothetical protein
MQAVLDTAGERLQVDCEPAWIAELLAEGAAGAMWTGSDFGSTVDIRIEADRRPFQTKRWPLLARGATAHDGEVVVENVLTSGFDVHVRCADEHAELTFRWRPPRRERIATILLRSRFHLLARAALIQYPALWWAGSRGRVPLHGSACSAGGSTPLVVSPSGVGRSTLVAAEVAAGGETTGDNLAVTDGTTVWGLVEPMRMSGLGGRRMPHGRGEAPVSCHVHSLVPDSVVVLSRGRAERAELSVSTPEAAVRALVTSTYMAGELRRYWAYAATLAAGTNVGPAQAAIAETAEALTAKLTCYSLVLGEVRPSRLTELLATREVEPAWA